MSTLNQYLEVDFNDSVIQVTTSRNACDVTDVLMLES